MNCSTPPQNLSRARSTIEIDTPENCDRCPLGTAAVGQCQHVRYWLDHRPSDCPAEDVVDGKHGRVNGDSIKQEFVNCGNMLSRLDDCWKQQSEANAIVYELLCSFAARVYVLEKAQQRGDAL